MTESKSMKNHYLTNSNFIITTPMLNRIMLAMLSFILYLLRAPFRLIMGWELRQLVLGDLFVQLARLLSFLGLNTYRIIVRMGRWNMITRANDGSDLGIILTTFNKFTKALFGEHEGPLLMALRRKLHPETIAMDIGAHIGKYTMIMAHLVGDNGQVIALEPDIQNFTVLTDNILLNGYKNVKVLRSACTEHKGHTKIYLTKSSSLHSVSKDELIKISNFLPSRTLRSGICRPVPSTSIDSILNELTAPVDLIKVDVEGLEEKVLQGAEKTLTDKQIRTILLETHHWYSDTSKIKKLLVRKGYTIHCVSPLHIMATAKDN